MRVQLSCSKCHTVRMVKAELAGKRVRCPGCQAVITVPAASEPAAATDEDPWDLPESEAEAESPRPSRKSARSGGTPKLHPAQKVILYLRSHPWAGFAAIYCGFWIPLSFVLPAVVLAANTIGVLVCWLLALVGMVMAAIGVTVRNPLTVLSTVAFGVVASMVIPSDSLVRAGALGGAASHRVTGKSFGELDVGAGGVMAATMAGLSILLLFHIVCIVMAIPTLLSV
jgi:hypothetical protein